VSGSEHTLTLLPYLTCGSFLQQEIRFCEVLIELYVCVCVVCSRACDQLNNYMIDSTALSVCIVISSVCQLLCM